MCVSAVLGVIASRHNPPLRCARCGQPFFRQDGRAQHGQHRSKDVLYCSKACAKRKHNASTANGTGRHREGFSQGQRGSWYFVLDLGDDPVTGKRKQHRQRGFAKKEDAEKAMDALKATLANGPHVSHSKLTLAKYLDGWLAAMSAGGPEADDHRGYRAQP